MKKGISNNQQRLKLEQIADPSSEYQASGGMDATGWRTADGHTVNGLTSQQWVGSVRLGAVTSTWQSWWVSESGNPGFSQRITQIFSKALEQVPSSSMHPKGISAINMHTNHLGIC